MWTDVITRRIQAVPGEPLMPGQWVYDGSGAITVQDARAVPGNVLLPGSDGKAGLAEHPHVACNSKLVWDDAAIRTMANVAGRLDAIRDADWSRWLEEPPVLPAINENLDETDIEREIANKVGYLEAACQRPRTHLENDEERLDVARCKRPATRAMLVLATRSDDWAGRSLLEVQPKRVLAVVREEVFDTYENRLVVALVDRLDAVLASRLRAVRRVVVLLTQQAGFEEKFFEINQQSRDFRRIERISTLWGEGAQGLMQREHADRVYARLRSLRRRVLALRDSVLYRSLGKQSQTRMQLRMTNILLHDDVYKRVAELWTAWETHMRHSIDAPQIVWDRSQEAARGFDLFTHLVVVRALQQLGYCVDEDAMGGVGQENEQMPLTGPLGKLTIEKERVGTIIRSGVGDQIVRVIGLPAMTEAISGIDAWWNTVKSEPVVIAALSAEEVRASDEEISAMRTIRCRGDHTEALHVAIAPWDLESVERMARVLRWHIWSTCFSQYPARIGSSNDIVGALGPTPAFMKLSRGQAAVIVRPPKPSERWNRPQELQAEREQAFQSQKATVDGMPARDRRRAAERQILDQRAQELESATRWVEDYEAGREATERLATCPICGERCTKFEEDSTDPNSPQFLCGCGECGAKWGLRRCLRSECGKRYPFLLPKGHHEPCSGLNVDRLYGADVLAFPKSATAFCCPHCGDSDASR
jgi:hypothetical protein